MCITHGVAQGGGKRNQMQGGEEELLELLLPAKMQHETPASVICFPIFLSKSEKSGDAASWMLISNLCHSQYEPV